MRITRMVLAIGLVLRPEAIVATKQDSAEAIGEIP